ncbi:MAG: hypothetical protein MUF49_20980 [Oculatellaceae cyanobacterium Prado106]|nr:hypothetical protein [Oculatellaceae cyanobacterium Prado106]
MASALDPQTLLLLDDPLSPDEITFLENGIPPVDPAIVTGNTVSQSGLTTPSLWWARQLYGEDLLSNWLAQPAGDRLPNRVDLLVNQTVWNRYNYLNRYSFLTRIGTAARDFGYSTRIFNAQGELLGAYICDFDDIEAEVQPQTQQSNCAVFLDPSGPGAIRGTGGGLLDGFGATDGGIDR